MVKYWQSDKSEEKPRKPVAIRESDGKMKRNQEKARRGVGE